MTTKDFYIHSNHHQITSIGITKANTRHSVNFYLSPYVYIRLEKPFIFHATSGAYSMKLLHDNLLNEYSSHFYGT